MLPTPRRRNLPDLARVEADLRQLELRNVSMDQITAVCDRYIKARERIYIDGFQVEKGAPTVRGVPAVVAFGIQSILLGCIALRDPEWREAMRVHGNYYETDEDVGEPCSEPTETDEDAADDFA